MKDSTQDFGVEDARDRDRAETNCDRPDGAVNQEDRELVLSMRIINLMRRRQRPVNAVEVASACGVRLLNARIRLHRMEKEGRIVRTAKAPSPTNGRMILRYEIDPKGPDGEVPDDE